MVRSSCIPRRFACLRPRGTVIRSAAEPDVGFLGCYLLYPEVGLTGLRRANDRGGCLWQGVYLYGGAAEKLRLLQTPAQQLGPGSVYGANLPDGRTNRACS